MVSVRVFFVIAAIFLWLPQKSIAQTYEQMRDSLEVASAALHQSPDNIDLRLRKASWNISLEQWEYARNEYNRILEKEPNNIAALYFRAYTNEKLHRYKYARNDYEAVLRIVPGNFNATLGLALLNQKDMHFTEAMDLINQLVQQHPDSALAYAARAGMELERNMLDLAEYDFSEAIRLAPDNTDYVINRADVRIRMGHRKKALSDLNKAVKMGVPKPTLFELFQQCR